MHSAGPQSGAIVLLSHAARSGRLPPGRMLAHALRELGRTDEWRQVLRESSVVREVSLNLARYLTLFIPSVAGQRSLLSEALAMGLDAWRDLDNTRSPLDRYHAYLRGLLAPLPQVLEWAVYVSDSSGEIYWDPMVTGLVEFQRGHAGTIEVMRRQRPRDSTFVDVAAADFRFLVLVRFLARRELRLAPLAPRFSELVCRYG